MPTYQYACKQCDHRFEVVQSFSDASLTECPECAGTLRKLYGAVGVIFKGSGFYRNDARSDSSKAKPAAADAKPAAKTESSPAKSDSSSTTSAASSSSTPTKAAAAS